jgi:hypothetical protein
MNVFMSDPKTILVQVEALTSRFCVLGGSIIRRERGLWKLAVTVLSLFACSTVGFGADRLESVEDDLTATKMDRAYHKLWEQKLLNRDAMLQFVSAPGGGGSETGISISRMAQRDDSGRPQFRLVVKEASSSLWSVVVAKYEQTAKPANVKVTTCEVPVPESTALVVHRAWLKMLQEIDPAPKALVLDATREIVFARTNEGRVLRARLPLSVDLGINNKRLLKIASLLSRCCNESEAERVRDLRQIETLAKGITAR